MKKAREISKNTVWLLKISFINLPIVTTARILGATRGNIQGLVVSFIVGLIIDWTIVSIDDPRQLERYMMLSLAVFGIYLVINGLISALNNYGQNNNGFMLGWIIPERMLYEKMNSLSIAATEDPKIQNLISRFRENRWNFSSFVDKVINISGIVFSLVISIGSLLVIMPVVAVLLFIATIPAIIFNNRMIQKLWQLDKDVTTESRRAGNLVYGLSHPQSLKEIKQLGIHSYLEKYFVDYGKHVFGRRQRIYLQWGLFDIINIILSGAAILFGIYQLILLAVGGTISPGQIAFYIGVLTSVGGQLDTLSAVFSDYIGSNERIQEMRSLLEYKDPYAKNSKDAKAIDRFSTPPVISFENVSFSYPNAKKLALQDISITIRPGEKIAIVGENGAGKSTFVKLLSGIYQPTSGKITMDGVDLQEIESSSWFNNLGILHQDFNKYTDLSAFENIMLGDIGKGTDVDYKDIIKAAEMADAAGFIDEYEHKYSQILSEQYDDGIRPSVGQWQKIAIARFFYRSAPLLILDEPTSAIDAVAEANIFDRVYEFVKNKSVIIISHRFSTVRNADRIIVINKGQIAEQGTHEELLEMSGIYAQAFSTQAKGYT